MSLNRPSAVLTLPPRNADLLVHLIVGEHPVELDAAVAELAHVARVELRADAELVVDFDGGVEAAVGHLAGAVVRPHGQEVVVAGENETLLHEAVNLDFPAGDFEGGLGASACVAPSAARPTNPSERTADFWTLIQVSPLKTGSGDTRERERKRNPTGNLPESCAVVQGCPLDRLAIDGSNA